LAETRGSGRFLPPDPRVEEPYRLTPQLALRVAMLGFAAVAVFAVLFLRLWALQVLSGTKYRVAASDNRVRTMQIEAQRGTVVDRTGHVLVTNTLGTSLELWQADLPKSWPARRRELNAIAAVANVNVQRIYAQMRRSAHDPLTPIVLAGTIHSAQIGYFEEHQFEFPGIQLVDTYQRNYPYGSLAAQVLGYVGPISQAELGAATRAGYQPQDVMGQAGVESTYDRYLRGKPGLTRIQVNALGEPAPGGQLVSKPPVPGDNLKLSLMANVQEAGEQALASRGLPGAFLTMNVDNGQILALGSYPTYDPSVFTKPLTQTQVNAARGDQLTRIPAVVTRPAHW